MHKESMIDSAKFMNLKYNNFFLLLHLTTLWVVKLKERPRKSNLKPLGILHLIFTLPFGLFSFPYSLSLPLGKGLGVEFQVFHYMK